MVSGFWFKATRISFYRMQIWDFLIYRMRIGRMKRIDSGFGFSGLGFGFGAGKPQLTLV